MTTFRVALLARTIASLVALAACPQLAAQQHPNQERGFAADRFYQFSELDRVNPLNGNVILEIPIGAGYPLGGGMSYGLTLSYNSKVWDFEDVWIGSTFHARALPNRRSNAGLGWLLSPGRLILPSDPSNDSFGFWVYESPDGADHVLYASLHGEGDGGVPGEATTWYSRDGGYLRMRDLGNGFRELDLGDGQIHQFRSSDGKLTQIRDRFGNNLAVTYPTSTNTRLTDQHGRTQNIHFVAKLFDGVARNVVDRVVLTAFAGTSATYQFVYADTSVRRGDTCVAYPVDPSLSVNVTVPLLTRVDLPDGSSFQVSTYTDSPDFSCREGAIRSLTLPTLGRIEWTWQGWAMPSGDCNNNGLQRSAGVLTKRLLTASGIEQGLWQYQWSTSTPPAGWVECNGIAGVSAPWEEMKVTITTPLRDKLVHYFSVWPHPLQSPTAGFRWTEYGLPLTRFQADATGTRFLSTQTLDCDAAGGNCVVERSTYVSYERDTLSEPGLPGAVNANRRLLSGRTIYHDDGNRVADTTHSSFDGLGHYRQVTTGGTFTTGNARTSFTNHNPAQGTYPGSFTMLAPSAPWLLDTYTHQDQIEAGVTARVEACFDAATGFLRRVRRLKTGTAAGANDVVVLYTPDAAGNVVREQHYGGDLQSLGTGALCSLSLPGDRLRIDHGYQHGVLASSQYFTASGIAMSFRSLDRDVDLSTGLVKTSRDSAGLATTFEYDNLGRSTWTMPATGHDGWTEQVYTRATSASALAMVAFRLRNNGSKTATILDQQEVWFDAFGRPWQERQLMPNGTWSIRETLYNVAGWRQSVSELGNTARRTQYLNYNPYGQPELVRPPDGSAHDIVLRYFGDRLHERTLKVGGSRDLNGNIVETAWTTTQRYDRQGRLDQVVEPSGASGANVTTNYTYDVGHRLRRVSTTSGATTQIRDLVYDNRGFLSWEKHPEKGPGTCNASGAHVCYASYDPRGRWGQRTDGGVSVLSTYDRAERLLEVKEAGVGGRLLKTFTYATANSGGNFKNGRLEVASRFNYVVLGTTLFTDEVRETYAYAGRQGRVSSRTTENFINGNPPDAFTQSWVYNALGQVTSLGYPQCTTCSVPAARTVSFGYTNGELTAVTGYTGTVAGQATGVGITYHPNGMVSQVAHGNGVTWTQANDPNMLRRPASIATSGAVNAAGAAADWSTGTYAYDGSGNVAKIGTSWFLYDPVSRLTTGTVFDGLTGGGTQKQQTYSYDAFGNVTAIGGSPGRSTPTAPATNRLTGGTYDSAGNLTAWNGNSYTYDPLGQVWRVVTGGGHEWIHIYTADDERLFSYQVAGGEQNRWTIRDLDGKVLREYGFDHPTATWHVDRDLVHRGNVLLSGETPSGRVHYHVDHLGTPRLITNAARLGLAYHVYFPYGEEATAFNQDAERMKFTGHERDLHDLASAADDLDSMHARYYNPLVARFLSVDPANSSWKPEEPQSWNRYSYTQGNPMNFVDPDGTVRVCSDPEQCRPPKTAWEKLQRELELASILPGPAPLAMAGRAGVTALGLLMSRMSRVLGRAAPALDDSAVIAQTVQRFAQVEGRAGVLRRVLEPDGTLRVGGKVAQQLGDSRSHIPIQSILDTIGSGTRVPDPQGVKGFFLYTAQANYRGVRGTLEILVDERQGRIFHVLFRRTPRL